MSTRSYNPGAELPSLTYELRDADDALIDFSTGWTFTLTIVPRSDTVAEITKSSGITGAATSPNITVNWATSELEALEPGTYRARLRARRASDSKDRDAPDVDLIIGSEFA